MGTMNDFDLGYALRSDRRSLLKRFGAAAVAISFGTMASGCDERTKPSIKIPPTGEEAKLNFYSWDTYIGEHTLEDFNGASGTKVSMSFFSTNDELFAKLRSGNPGFDVIVPSDDGVARLGRAGLLQPLDHTLIPNFKNIAPEFRDVPFDPKRALSMPYTWLAMGIGYRKSKIKGVPDSWKWIFDSDAYKNRIALVSEAGDLFRLYARYLGHSINAMTPALISEIEPLLTRQKANIKSFHEDNGQELLLSGEVDLVLEYNGDIAQVMKDDDDIGFVIPKEGSQLNADNLAIPKGAPHPKNAHAFINYMLDGEVGKQIAEKILFPTPNSAAKALMPPEYRNNSVIFPSAEELKRCNYVVFDEKLQALYEEAFTRIRAA
jgi:spermidine/putrescine transport system substrate-binding protein